MTKEVPQSDMNKIFAVGVTFCLILLAVSTMTANPGLLYFACIWTMFGIGGLYILRSFINWSDSLKPGEFKGIELGKFLRWLLSSWVHNLPCANRNGGSNE